jgi:CheY-like chemotaxis protein
LTSLTVVAELLRNELEATSSQKQTGNGQSPSADDIDTPSSLCEGLFDTDIFQSTSKVGASQPHRKSSFSDMELLNDKSFGSLSADMSGPSMSAPQATSVLVPLLPNFNIDTFNRKTSTGHMTSNNTSTTNDTCSSRVNTFRSYAKDQIIQPSFQRTESFLSDDQSSIGTIPNPVNTGFCLNIIEDLYSSVQQLGLFVEMGLVLGEMTLTMTELTSQYAPYELSNTDIFGIYDKVQWLTQKFGRHSVVQWDLDVLRSMVANKNIFVHGEMLLAVLMSCLTQLLPHSDKIDIRVSIEDFQDMRLTNTPRSTRSCLLRSRSSKSAELIMRDGWEQYLVTRLEIYGNAANLEELVQQLNIDCKDNLSIQPSISKDDLGDCVFAIGCLLGNINAESHYNRNATGGVFSFAFPCKLIDDSQIALMKFDTSFENPTNILSSYSGAESEKLSSKSPCRPTSMKVRVNSPKMASMSREVSVNEASLDTDFIESLQTLSRAEIAILSDKHLQVLVVDDSIIVQKVLGQWMRRKKCIVTTAHNGEEALYLMQKRSFDFILLDFLMPVMDGLTCLQKFQDFQKSHRVNAEERDSHQWIVGFSATAMTQDQELAFQYGMDLFSTKPIDMQAFSLILSAKRLGITLEVLNDLIEANRRFVMTSNQEMLMENLVQLTDNQSTKKSGNKKLFQARPEKVQSLHQNVFGGFQTCAY